MRILHCITLLGLEAAVIAGAGLSTARAEPIAKVSGDDRPVLLTLVVPANAEVWIEGTKTTMTGTVRQFLSPAIKPGQNYIYTLRVRWQRNNKDMDETRNLTVQAGDAVRLDYSGQSAGYAMTPSISTGERSLYYSPDAEPARPAPTYYRPSAPYYSAPASRSQSYYGNTPGVGGPGTTW